MKKYQYKLEGLDCAKCANKIQEELSKNKKLKNEQDMLTKGQRRCVSTHIDKLIEVSDK